MFAISRKWWHEDDDKQIVRLVKQGLSKREIAFQMGRSLGSLTARMRERGIKMPRGAKPPGKRAKQAAYQDFRFQIPEPKWSSPKKWKENKQCIETAAKFWKFWDQVNLDDPFQSASGKDAPGRVFVKKGRYETEPTGQQTKPVEWTCSWESTHDTGSEL